MKYKIFSFQYLRSKPAKLLLFGIVFVFGCLAPLFYLWYWDSLRYRVENKYTKSVYLYDIISPGDTLDNVLAIKELRYKDSLIGFYKRRYIGVPDYYNFPFIILKGGPFPFIEYTKDSLLGKIIFAKYTSPKYYEEYFVFKKSLHFK